MGFPGGTSGKVLACHCRKLMTLEFNPWVGKIPWRRAWQPTPLLLPGESHGQRRVAGYTSIVLQRVAHEWNNFVDKGPSSQRYGFSSSHVWMWELDHKESWVPKNWCFWTVVLEKTLQSPLDCKEIKTVNPKGNKSWIFIGITDAEAETPILWPSDLKKWLTGKDPDAGKDWMQEKGKTEDEMVEWHHWLDGHELE